MHRISKISIISLIIIFIDQLTKIIAKEVSFEIFSFFKLIWVKNSGAAFGIFQNNNTPLIFLSIAILGFLLFYLDKIPNQKSYNLSISLIIGGAIGNLIDRIFFGYVRDFISIWIWPVFNIADMAITIGIILILIKEINKKK